LSELRVGRAGPLTLSPSHLTVVGWAAVVTTNCPMEIPAPNSETVTYRSITSEALEALGPGWDAMQVIYSREDGGVIRIANSFTIARDASGAIMRKTESLPERWEVVKDPDEYRGFEACFDARDKLAAKKAKGARGEVS
jgi:hypothetical protein